MNLQNLFGSKERVKILEHVMTRDNLRVTQISKELKISKGLVSEFMRILQKNGLVRRENGAVYSPADNPATREVKRIINLSKVRLRRINKERIEGIGIYGSWARGTNVIDSDVDVWVKAKEYPPQEYLAKLSSQLRKMLGGEVRLLVLTPKKMRQISKDEVFFSSLVRDSVLLWGEDIA
ncbi:MAG: ArsR family transcriptional regulator [Methanomassiliicoccales archaeon]|nr:MAG: ArsR family transcriptional regulator [Methanomassiliicoccales archaeon]